MAVREEKGGCLATRGGEYLEEESTGDEWQIKREEGNDEEER